jgi:type II secretory pathway component PulM
MLYYHLEVRRMNEKVLSQPTLETDADYEAAIEQYLAEMRRLNEQMNNDRSDIERLKAETETLKTQTRALLATLPTKNLEVYQCQTRNFVN